MFPRRYFPSGNSGSAVLPPALPAAPAVTVSVEEALVAWLKLQPAIAALVGTRIYDQSLRQAVSINPGQCAITYRVESDLVEENLDGSVSGDYVAVIVLTLHAMTEADAGNLGQLIRGRQTAPSLDGWRGWMGTATVMVWTQYVRVTDRPASFVPDIHGSDLGFWLPNLAVTIAYFQP